MIRRWLSLVLVASFALPALAEKPALTCAVEGVSRGIKAGSLCKAVAGQLGRSVTVVSDAREAKKGEAVQLITGDVQWTVIWLVEGRVRTWTKVSKLEAADEQLKQLAHATRELAKQAAELAVSEGTCLRVDPNKLRANDLSYPWAELSPCKRKLVEVLDPWWLPEAPAGKPAP